jgi:hypothetical protein
LKKKIFIRNKYRCNTPRPYRGVQVEGVDSGGYSTVVLYNNNGVITMAKETKINQPLLQEVMDGMTTLGKYNHLQIILSKNNNRRMGQKYLVVSPVGFGVYQLLDVDYDAGIIQMKLMDTNTVKIVHVNQNINDDSMHLILICWKDIVRIVRKEDVWRTSNEEVLDFDY